MSPGGLAAALERELAPIPDRSVVEIILSGALSPEEYDARARVLEGALARFLEGRYWDGEVSRLITEGQIAAEFPETSFSARFLTRLLDEPLEAQMAYDLLKGMGAAGQKG